MATGSRANTSQDSTRLLDVYSAQFGAALRRRQSAVALRAAKVEAELAYKARGAFLQEMNHELRTPLNAITGFAGMLRQTDPQDISPKEYEQYLDYILQSAELLLSHINTILEVADAESGGSKLARRAFDLTEILEDLCGEEQRVVFTLDLDDDLPPVDADPDKIAKAVRHLLSYLIDTDVPNQRIKISTRRGLANQSEGLVYVAMEGSAQKFDRGAIDEELRVFERVHEGLHRRIDINRLNLPIAKSYIELNGGKFNLKPSRDGKLLTRFALPVAAAAHLVTFERLVS